MPLHYIAMPLHYMVGAAVAFAVFILVFIRTEAGLYLVLFSMLLSPEFGAGPRRLAEGRTVSIRLEDILLIVITLSWLAKMSINKEIGLVIKTRLNRPIVAYIAATLLATIVGYLSGTIRTTGGWFYVLKYVEYFVVFIRIMEPFWFFRAIVVALPMLERPAPAPVPQPLRTFRYST